MANRRLPRKQKKAAKARIIKKYGISPKTKFSLKGSMVIYAGYKPACRTFDQGNEDILMDIQINNYNAPNKDI